jgi:hypothetical protein
MMTRHDTTTAYDLEERGIYIDPEHESNKTLRLTPTRILPGVVIEVSFSNGKTKTASWSTSNLSFVWSGVGFGLGQ